MTINDNDIYKVILLCIFCRQVANGLESVPVLSNFYNPKQPSEITINKVSLTQKGYIQFLRYVTDVPAINEFTFCIWLRSTNMTNSQPILSYSKLEKARYVRAWISPRGKAINLEILGNKVFSVPVEMEENHWYHICESWDNRIGTWQLYFNGKLKAAGVEGKLRGVTIPPLGDVIVGQEYTDFNKGLDDGIEGDIYGFNLLLECASEHANEHRRFTKSTDTNVRRQMMIDKTPTTRNVQNKISNERNVMKDRITTSYFPQVSNRQLTMNVEKASTVRMPQNAVKSQTTVKPDGVPNVLGYFPQGANRSAKEFLNLGTNLFGNLFSFFDDRPTIRVMSVDNNKQRGYHLQYPHYFNALRSYNKPYVKNTPTNSRILNEVPAANAELVLPKPLGLLLMELSFNNCAQGKGTPMVDDKMIISWTKTPVRVFGGAIWMPVPPFCTQK